MLPPALPMGLWINVPCLKVLLTEVAACWHVCVFVCDCRIQQDYPGLVNRLMKDWLVTH